MAFRFHHWPVYLDIRKLRKDLRAIILRIPDSWEQREIGSQMRRAILSAMANLAEGSFRSTDKDFGSFVNRSAASMYEVVCLLDALFDDAIITEEEKSSLQSRCEGVVQQLVAFQKKLNPINRLLR